MYYEISFISKNKLMVNVTISVGDYVSFRGECGSSYGQIWDDFDPTEKQGKLVDMWKAYHLKGKMEQEVEDKLKGIIRDIEEEEKEREKKLFNKDKIYQISERERALLDYLGLGYGDSDNLYRIGNCKYKIYGRSYYIGTQRELERVAYEELIQDSGMWQDAVANGHTELGLKDWAKEVIEEDGIGDVLNHYNGEVEQFAGDGYSRAYLVCREF